MRTAEEIFKENRIKIGVRHYVNKESFIQSLNESRKEVIKECANLAKKLYEETTYTPNTTQDEILKLIDNLK